jgi:hypothetical protein
MTKTLRGKCPRCCPDGGACFERYGDAEKRCNNCHLVLPFRRIKPTGKATASQQEAIDRILATFGGTVTKLEMIGRKAWVEIKNPARHWALGDTVYGAIGAGGKLELKMHRLYGDAIIRNDIDVSVYLG